LGRWCETVFYVGQSHNTYNRLLAHLGLDGRSGPNVLGRLILDHAPRSDGWHFEEYTLEECRPFVLAYRVTLPEPMQAFYQSLGNHYDVDLAEEALMKLHRPCLNTAMNPNPPPLPERYQHRPEV